MGDVNYWKDAYADTWRDSSSREDAVKKMIEKETGKKVEEIGLGAGSEEYLAGSAASQGHERGGSDLGVVGTNINVEVTGPLVDYIKEEEPLWVRPDKIDSARSHHPERDTWVVHCLGMTGKIRVIRLDDEFFERLDAGDFPIVNPRIRGRVETYREIQANHACVRDLKDMFDTINQT